MTGPSPKSYCNHNPGSVTHGRCTRACPEPVLPLDRGDRPPGRPLRPGEPHRHQLVVGDVGADLALRLLDPFLDLGQELVDQPRPARPRRGRRRRPARRPTGRPCGASTPPAPRRHATNRSNRTPPEFPWIPRQTSSGPSWGLVGRVSTAKRTSGGTPTAGRGRDGQGRVGSTTHDQVGSFVATSGQKPWPSAGCFVAAYGQFFMAADRWYPVRPNFAGPALVTRPHTTRGRPRFMPLSVTNTRFVDGQQCRHVTAGPSGSFGWSRTTPPRSLDALARRPGSTHT